MTRLGKAQVEALLANYDAASMDALTHALRITLDAPTLEWAALVDLADFSGQRKQHLLRGDPATLDELAAELNEVREVAARRQAAQEQHADRSPPR